MSEVKCAEKGQPWLSFGLKPAYTVRGNGVMVVTMEEPTLFFIGERSFVDGKPNMSLDGGCHADARVYILSDEMLRDWKEEGWVRSMSGFRKAMKAVWSEGWRYA